MIKFFDLYKQDKKYHRKIISKLKKIITRTNYILGKEVQDFENNFSNYVGAKYAIGCANGTDALTIALKSLNLPKNSEVIIPAMTYCSTAFSVINCGLRPVLVDIGFNTSSIDINKIQSKITSKTKVIMPVHLYGSSADLNSIKKIIKNNKKKIYLVDDCSQAHGAIDDSDSLKRKIGSTSDISCFSLYPGKNLGAYGDAGIITTNNKKIYQIIRKLRNLGSEKKFIHEYVGFNSRLDTIQAAILDIKLKDLTKSNNKRRIIAKKYDKEINNKNFTKLTYAKNSVYHQYVLLVKNRDKFVKFLNKHKIEYGFHYPFSINQLNVFKNKFKNNEFRNSNKLAKNGISLPIDPNLSNKQLNYIVNKINSF
tara:strand:- start:1282 stop:2382 length:1101 start_codon:yes stop_codon:yes gene_type:complete